MKEEASALEEFLLQAGKQGALEGEHVFRVDTVGALSRLSDFRLPSPHHWVVKIVQWANTIEAESVSFKLGRRESEVVVSGLPPSSASQVLRDMTKVATLSDHLVTALLSLAREDTPSFELEIFREEEHEASRGWRHIGERLTIPRPTRVYAGRGCGHRSLAKPFVAAIASSFELLEDAQAASASLRIPRLVLKVVHCRKPSSVLTRLVDVPTLRIARS